MLCQANFLLCSWIGNLSCALAGLYTQGVGTSALSAAGPNTEHVDSVFLDLRYIS